MNRSEYKDFYDKVGKLNGWDFSKLRTASNGEQWDFLYEVTQKCNKSDLLLHDNGKEIMGLNSNGTL